MGKGPKNAAISLLFTLIAYFVLANLYKNYRSEVDVLIVPQNEKTAVMNKQVLANAAKIPLTVSFFDRLSKNNLNINNPVDGFSGAEKKNYWNSKLKTNIIKDSGIVKFLAKDPDSAQAESIASASAKNDLLYLSSYYNIKEDVQMRIIDGPITSQFAGYKSLRVIIFSLIFGIILAIILSWLENAIKNQASSQKMRPLASDILPKDTFTIKNNAKLEKEKAKKKAEEDYIILAKETPKVKSIAEKTPEAVSYEKKATAPGNLPIADTSIMSMFGATKNGTGYKMPMEKSEPKQKEEKPAVYREATEEEVKERLNRLLGEM